MTTAIPAPLSKALGCIDLSELTDVLEQSTVLSRLDLGSTLVYKVIHPTRGALVLINTTGNDHGIIEW